ncbi:MAG: fibronectin type III domain-containing protein, partial [Saprospiraceae bacterium]|nr:fibronectin type III domain-containing protein [Saprospiraceae bacterium]
RGAIRGAERSLAAVSFGKNGIMGLLADDRYGNLVLGKLESPDNETEYILYADTDLKAEKPVLCSTPIELERGMRKPTATAQPESSSCVRVYFEADYELFQNKGSVQNTVDYLTGAFNQVAALYANEQINTALSQVYVWVTPDNYSTTSSSNALKDFRAIRQNFNGDLAHLVGIGGNNLGGIAYLDVLCVPSYAYAFSDISTSYATVPTYSWTVEVLTHEMGHNLGSPHTQSCSWPGGPIDNCFSPEGNCSPGPAPVNGGTIMSYCHLTGNGINFSNGFGPLPGGKIRTEVANAVCLSGSCAPTGSCPAPSGIAVTNITTNSALISWTNAAGANSYQLEWRKTGDPGWTVLPATANPFLLQGLPAGTAIEVRLQSICGGANSGYSFGPIFSTGGNGPGASCGPVENLGAAATSATTALISWKSVAGAVGYQLFYKPSSSSSWGTPVQLTSNSYSLNNLTPSTKYDLRVAAQCGSSSSAFAQTTFTTPSGGSTASCGLPANFAAIPTAANSVQVSWHAVNGASYYQLWYKAANSYYYNTGVKVTGTSFTLTGLSANTSYHVRLRAVCNSSASAFQTVLVTTPGTDPGNGCPTPSNFILSSVSATSAVVSWNPVSGAQAYDVQIKQAGSVYWMTFINLPSTVIQITNLQANSHYQVRVRARCSGSNNYSPYTATLDIHTPANLNPELDELVGLPASGQVIRLDETNLQTALAWRLAPNPATEFVTVLLTNGLSEEHFTVQLFDSNGRFVHATQQWMPDGGLRLDLQALPPGVYYIRAAGKGLAPAFEKLIRL